MASPRYQSLVRLASGGMATVWIGTVRGALGFRQLVAIKKPHPHLLHDEGFRSELIAEARLASLIHHANVVDVRDCEIDGEEISLVMDYIEGASLGELIVAASQREQLLPVRAAVRIVRDAAAGLHAAHELVDERNRPVGLVHRDISPQNILVGTDGIGRVTDFGVAKFARKYGESTSEGSLKGKLAYMAPEYVRGETIDRRFDVFALGVVLWESLTGRRLFRGASEAETLQRLIDHVPPRVSTLRPELAPLDDVVAFALAKSRDERFQNAAAMGAALETAASESGLLGNASEVAACVASLVGPALDERRALIRSKLADEPSVASLMGTGPHGPIASAAVSTERSGPPEITSPMISRTDPMLAAPAMTTLRSDGEPLVMNDATATAYTMGEHAAENAEAVVPRPRRAWWLVAALGLAVPVAIFVAIRQTSVRTTAAVSESSAVPSAAPAAPPPPIIATSAPEPSAAPAPSPTTRPAPPTTPRPKRAAPPPPAPAPTPTPTPTGKKPPPNPYAE